MGTSRTTSLRVSAEKYELKSTIGNEAMNLMYSGRTNALDLDSLGLIAMPYDVPRMTSLTSVGVP